MKTRRSLVAGLAGAATLSTAALTLAAAATTSGGRAGTFDLEFDDGVAGWRVVLDGVMGGLSTGRVSQPDAGVLRFTGDLSLENNGGFSQIRRAVSGDEFTGADGIEIRVRGDGRVYTFDIRASNARMMAGSFQQQFLADTGDWTTLQLPFDDFRLNSFGRQVRNAPALDPAKIESIGVTIGDKKTGPFRLEIDSIRTYSASAPTTRTASTRDAATNGGRSAAAGSRGAGDLASVATAAGLTTLLDLVGAAGLELPEGERLTILAPTNDAFAALPRETVEHLLSPAGRDDLRSILTYHVLGEATGSSVLLARRALDTLNGQRLPVEVGAALRVGGATIITADVPFDGGVVHVIDRVLLPETKTIAELAGDTDALSTLAAAVRAAGLGDVLGPENGPFTVFAPVNDAFAALPAGVLEDLLRSDRRRDLVRILGLHVVPGRIHANELLSNPTLPTYLGEAVTVTLDQGAIRVGGARLLATDVPAANGVVHLIDTVILPAADSAASEPKRTDEAAAAAALQVYGLAVDRGVPLFNNGQPAACAAVYEVALASMIVLGRERLGRDVIARLETGLARGLELHSAEDRAWAYRDALDAAATILAERVGEMRNVEMTSRDT